MRSIFFDGFKANPDYALAILKKAFESGADTLVLCDTNGGTMPWELIEMNERVQREIDAPLGIHCHNDNGLSVANTLTAVKAGVGHVRGR